MFELYMTHGRSDAAQQMEDWGFEGPRLRGVIGLHETYRATLRIIFESTVAADEAEQATAWRRCDHESLEATIDDDMLRCGTGGAGAVAWFGDWGLIRPADARAADERQRHALRAALRFVEGFEGDELQTGIDGPTGLLAMLRGACGSDPAALIRSRVTVPAAAPFDPLRDLDPSLRAWLVDGLGMQAEPQGGGCPALVMRWGGGAHIMLTGHDGADFPSPDSWMVGVYAAGSDGETATEFRLTDKPGFTLRQAVRAAMALCEQGVEP